jgi:hypothetical protein
MQLMAFVCAEEAKGRPPLNNRDFTYASELYSDFAAVCQLLCAGFGCRFTHPISLTSLLHMFVYVCRAQAKSLLVLRMIEKKIGENNMQKVWCL